MNTKIIDRNDKTVCTGVRFRNSTKIHTPSIINLRIKKKIFFLFRLQEIKLLHGSKVEADVVVVCKDTDVFILMI